MTKGRQGRTCALLLAIALVLTACAWGQPGGNAARNGANPFEPGLTTANVDQLAPAWQADGVLGEPIMTNKYLYSTTPDGYLNAYAAAGPASADGASRCSGSPVVCTPVWFSHLSDFIPASDVVVDGDRLFTVASIGGSYRLVALDADPASCPATDGCGPRWTGQLGTPGAPSVSIAVSGGRVYVGISPDVIPGHPYVVVFDELGLTNCTAGPPRTCTPLFRAELDVSTGPGSPTIAVAGGRVFAGGTGAPTAAFDATGQTGCSNGICAPLYRLSPGGARAVSVSGTTVYATSGGTLAAYDVAGTTGCSGTPRVCAPEWTALLAGNATLTDPPTISNGKVFVLQDGFPRNGAGLQAFDAAGVQGCTGSPATCEPLWSVDWPETSGETNRISATPALLVMSGWTTTSFPPFNTQTLKTFDLSGATSCGGTPKRCTALSTTAVTGNQYGSSIPAVAFGRVAVTDYYGHLKVFAVPG